MMKQEQIHSKILGESYAFYRHESGLGILLYPMKGFASAYALFGTNYGSIDTTFKTQKDAEFVTVPEGIAHFLEHKLFESEEGNALEMFSKTGACANAFTSFDKTCYLFSTTDHFEETLKILMDCVQNPYFTEENVSKEQGIIGQEIKMYDDDPSWRVLFNLLTSLYHHNPVRIDIAGTVESIAKIDKDLLYRCYHTFYNLNNMVIAIAGNFDLEATARFIEENLKQAEKVEVTSQVPEEPREVVRSLTEQKLEVSMPLFYIGYKEEVPSVDDELKHQIYSEMLQSILIGRSSDLYRVLYEEELINSSMRNEVFCGRGFFINMFTGESRKPQQVKERLEEKIAFFKQQGIPQEDFERVKKAAYGFAIMSFNDVESVASNLVSSYFSGHPVYETMDVIAQTTLEDLNQFLKNSFCPEYSALSIIHPIDDPAE